MKYEIDNERGQITTVITPSNSEGYHWPKLAELVSRDTDPIIEGHRINFDHNESEVIARFCYDEPIEHKDICAMIEKVQDWFSKRMDQLTALINDLDIIKQLKEGPQDE
jgi:hypothetical protein